MGEGKQGVSPLCFRKIVLRLPANLHRKFLFHSACFANMPMMKMPDVEDADAVYDDYPHHTIAYYMVGLRPYRQSDGHALRVSFPATMEIAGNMLLRMYGSGILGQSAGSGCSRKTLPDPDHTLGVIPMFGKLARKNMKLVVQAA